MKGHARENSISNKDPIFSLTKKKIRLMLGSALSCFLTISHASFAAPPTGTQVFNDELIYSSVKNVRNARHFRLGAVTAPQAAPANPIVKTDEPLPFLGRQIAIRNVHLEKKLFHIHKSQPLYFHFLEEKYRRASNNYSIQPYASVFSTREHGTDYDYYHIALAGQFAPNPLLSQRHFPFLGNHPILVSGYTIDSYPAYYATGAWHKIDEAHALSHYLDVLDNWQPKVSSGQTTVTSSIGLQIEGQVSWAGAGPPGANVGINLQMTHSKERTILDESIFPYIGENGHVCWEYKFNNLTTNQEGGNDFSRATATPYVQWIWKVDRDQAEVNGLYFDDTPRGQLARSGPYYFNFGFDLKAEFKKVYKILPFKTVKSSKKVYNIMNAIPDQQLISIRVPDRLPQGCATKVSIL